MMVISISLLSGCGSKNAEKEDAETNELNSGMNSIDYNAISGQLTIIMVAFKRRMDTLESLDILTVKFFKERVAYG